MSLAQTNPEHAAQAVCGTRVARVGVGVERR